MLFTTVSGRGRSKEWCVRWVGTLAPSGKYSWMIVAIWCSLFPDYFDNFLWILTTLCVCFNVTEWWQRCERGSNRNSVEHLATEAVRCSQSEEKERKEKVTMTVLSYWRLISFHQLILPVLCVSRPTPAKVRSWWLWWVF